MRVSYQDLYRELLRVLTKEGFRQDSAKSCAKLFADASRDGVHTHGLNRFPRFVGTIRAGIVDIHAEPECVGKFAGSERWEGHLGPGNLNAQKCMHRAIELSREHGIGCVALQNTNHWMRGGSYGWQAAEDGVIGICWSNTMQNLPAWGGRDARLGNNPLVIAVPRTEGHIVLDMAMSQFSYGALASYYRHGEQLPVDGGFDKEGRLTRDPGAIQESGRPLPIGFWKGSGLSLVLDMVVALLSGGKASHQVPHTSGEEYAISQVFIAFDLTQLDASSAAHVTNEIIEHLHGAEPAKEDAIYYPGERTLLTRKENLAKGIPVEPSIWREVQSM